MTLETGVKALAEAVAVDVKALGEGKVDKDDVVGETGQSTEKVMSQKAVTDLVGDIESVLVAINGEP